MKRLFLTLALASSSVVLSAHAGAYEDFQTALGTDNVRLLTDLEWRGFDLNTPNEAGQPALWVALKARAFRVAEILVRQPKMQVNFQGPAGETPLMLAALHGQIGLLRAMLQHGAEVNQPGWTPLHYAATHSQPVGLEMVQLLLDHHAYIDAESPNQSTPLMMAARYGHPDTVKVLLEAGADVSLRNEQGWTAADFAQAAKRTELALSLQAAQAAWEEQYPVQSLPEPAEPPTNHR